MDASATLAGIRLVPVVVIAHEAAAVPLAEALLSGGIGAIEITLRTQAALPAIARVAAEVPDIIVGAGSLRRAAQMHEVARAGARFAVSPGCSPGLLGAAAELNMPFVPGAATASEMMALLDAGYQLQKFFPAEQQGGLPRIRALAAPLPEVRFFPTGGINQALARDYLACEAVSCVGGSWFVPAALVEAGDYSTIGSLVRETVEQVLGR